MFRIIVFVRNKSIPFLLEFYFDFQEVFDLYSLSKIKFVAWIYCIIVGYSFC